MHNLFYCSCHLCTSKMAITLGHKVGQGVGNAQQIIAQCVALRLGTWTSIDLGQNIFCAVQVCLTWSVVMPFYLIAIHM